ncbi:DUF1127 domain-containing protein [Phyllobacterium zundukense]|uniref:DUF1127 domain-containing protein n=1 Tax=Phyllobacterium zundukense TaxID=1867719 RepID=A0A2N9W0Q0_9HYPH|nr:DUF1127 domain-containing protein [Phyllobacterium zundukense]ATU90383.1 hypothetical protein BLM14_00910 [Phyllobacterium zundukense]PIO45318.1 hypothetical protein B5P45_07525 [Phyllobacterium zundukense]
MTYVDFNIINTVRRLLTDFAAYREELRTERHLNSLPEHVLKDIGWPDAYAERLARRGSMKGMEAGTESASADLAPWQLGWPKPRQAKKTGISGSFRVQY